MKPQIKALICTAITIAAICAAAMARAEEGYAHTPPNIIGLSRTVTKCGPLAALDPAPACDPVRLAYVIEEDAEALATARQTRCEVWDFTTTRAPESVPVCYIDNE